MLLKIVGTTVHEHLLPVVSAETPLPYVHLSISVTDLEVDPADSGTLTLIILVYFFRCFSYFHD